MKPLAGFTSQIEEGQVVATFDSSPRSLVCKLRSGRIVVIDERVGTTWSAQGETLAEFISSWEAAGYTPPIARAVSAIWNVVTEQIRRCAECGIPGKDGDFDMSLCFDCNLKMRRSSYRHTADSELTESREYLKRDVDLLCEVLETLDKGVMAPDTIDDLFTRVHGHLNAVHNMVDLFHKPALSDPPDHPF